MKSVRFKTNIHCGSCVKSVTPFLNAVDEVEEWKVDTTHADKILEVQMEEEDEQLVIEAVQKAGFEIESIA